jgi:hypothetical protein
MKPDRRNPSEEKLEAELVFWLRARDAGPAPERLRDRVAAVTRQASGRSGFSRWFRPVSAVAGAAAIALVILVAVTLRTPGGVAAPSTTPPAATAAPSDTSLGLPFGPWPRTGSVPAIPLDNPSLEALAWTALLLAGVLFVLLMARSAGDARRSGARGVKVPALWRQMSWRAWFLRGAWITLLAALTVTGAGLFNLEGSTPLTYGSEFGAPGGRWLGYGNGDPSPWYYSFAPDGRMALLVSLRNEGDLPLTVTTFDIDRFKVDEPEFTAFVSSMEIRLPLGATNGFGSDKEANYSEAFHPFELPPRAETNLMLVLQLKGCRSTASPGPTPPLVLSSADAGSYVPPAGHVAFDTMPFRYSVLGIERETEVTMNTSVTLVFGNYPIVCDG